VSDYLVVMHTYLCYFPSSLSLFLQTVAEDVFNWTVRPQRIMNTV